MQAVRVVHTCVQNLRFIHSSHRRNPRTNHLNRNKFIFLSNAHAQALPEVGKNYQGPFPFHFLSPATEDEDDISHANKGQHIDLTRATERSWKVLE